MKKKDIYFLPSIVWLDKLEIYNAFAPIFSASKG